MVGGRRVWRSGGQEIFAGKKNLIIISNPLYANLTWRLQRTYVEEGACRRNGQEARRMSIIRGTI